MNRWTTADGQTISATRVGDNTELHLQDAEGNTTACVQYPHDEALDLIGELTK